MPKTKDLTGQRFGKLVAISSTNTPRYGSILWNCRCDCGNMVLVSASRLGIGNKKSCGCLKKEQPNHIRHGISRTRIYNIWNLMKNRCNNPNFEHYDCYGGRGIKVCEEWNKDFVPFFNYVSNLPHYGEKGYTLDRIDFEGNYEPGNVRWADKITQANNCRSNVLYEYNGESHTLPEWARVFDMNPHTLNSRVRIYKWDIDKALTTPIKKVTDDDNK